MVLRMWMRMQRSHFFLNAIAEEIASISVLWGEGEIFSNL